MWVACCRTFTIDRMPVFFKQRDNLFFPAWAFVVPTTIVRLPISFVESLLWTVFTCVSRLPFLFYLLFFSIDSAPLGKDARLPFEYATGL